jgi:hypothetical protein
MPDLGAPLENSGDILPWSLLVSKHSLNSIFNVKHVEIDRKNSSFGLIKNFVAQI